MDQTVKTDDEVFLKSRGWWVAEPHSLTGHKWRHPDRGPAQYRTWDAMKVQLDWDEKENGTARG